MSSIFGDYINELGSKMTIRYDGNGKISGEYQTNAGSPTFQEVFKLNGSYLQHPEGQYLITWAVRWVNDQKNYGSITSWVGQSDNGQKITAQYILKQFGTDQYGKNKFTGGQDTFQKVPSSKL